MMKRLELYGHPFAELLITGADMRFNTVMENDACLYYMINGKGEIYASTEKVVLSASEAILLKCGSYVGCFVDASPMDVTESIGFHFHPEVVQKLVESGKLSFNKPKTQSSRSTVKFVSNPELEQFIQGIMFYLNHPELISEEMLELKVQELLLILIKEGEQHPIVSSILSRLYKKEEVEFSRVIESNLFNNLSIPELAVLTNRSESTFKRDFKKYFEESPAKYIRVKRLQKASELLVTSDHQVSEIAWDCGFENAAHFSKSFFDHFGSWPRDFRSANA